MSRICVSLARAGDGGAFAEWRLDLIGALPATQPPGDWIGTCRAPWEGGAFGGGEDQRRSLLEAAAGGGAWAVDIELRASWRPRRPAGVKLILSFHDFERTPPDLDAIADRMLSEKPDVVKIAATARTPDDIRRLLALQARLRSRAVVVAMGDLGAPARILAARLGAPWTYAAADGGPPTAPGQFTASALRALRYDRIGPATRAFGVAGDPVAHSRSPALFNELFERTGLDAVFLPVRTPAGQLHALLDALGLEGASVTVPHKEEALRGAAADAHARAAGAANMLKRTPAGWVASNTDARGFREALEAGLGRPARDLRVLVLGAGGAARGVLAALAADNRIVVAGRTEARAKELAREFRARATTWEKAAGEMWTLLVNTTPVGMAPGVGETPFPAGALRAGAAVFDCVYTPAETRLLREAGEAGCVAIGGEGMFVAQAALQAEGWFGGRGGEEVRRIWGEGRGG